MELRTPLADKELERLKAGDKVFLNGIFYTARDAAHARLIELLEKDQETPFPLEGQVIYYVGPTPARPGQVIGSAGPTTSYRMDPFAPLLLKHGLKGMIGKGARSEEVREAVKKYRAIYFGAVGGAAALISKSIKKAEIIAYPELGPEAVRKIEVLNFPVIVINDIYGNDLYEEGIRNYKKMDI